MHFSDLQLFVKFSDFYGLNSQHYICLFLDLNQDAWRFQVVLFYYLQQGGCLDGGGGGSVPPEDAHRSQSTKR